MITLMVNVYDEDPGPAIASAEQHLGYLITRKIVFEGRYEGFPEEQHAPDSPVFPSEHEKRNVMLSLAGIPTKNRWLLWLDCDERVVRASPLLSLQLARTGLPMLGVRFVHPLPPNPDLLPGLTDERRRVRDTITENFGGRLYQHLPGLEYRGRHDNLWLGEKLLSGWRPLGPGEEAVRPRDTADLEIEHLWWQQPRCRREAKQRFYSSAARAAETASVRSLA